MNWIMIGKFAVKLVASSSVSTVVMNVVTATTPANTKALGRVMTNIGGFILSSMIADKASAYVINEIDAMLSKQEVEETDAQPIDQQS